VKTGKKEGGGDGVREIGGLCVENFLEEFSNDTPQRKKDQKRTGADTAMRVGGKKKGMFI